MIDNWPYFIVFLVFFLFVSFGCFILLINRNSRSVHYIISSLFFSLALSTIDVTLFITGTYNFYLHLAFWLGALALVYGPLIYLFTRSVLYTDKQITRRDILHFVPSTLYLLGVLICYTPKSITTKKLMLAKAAADEYVILNIVSLISILSIIIYLTMSYRLYRTYTQQLQNQYSSLEGKKLNWVKHVLFGFITLIMINVLLQVIDAMITGFDLLEPFSLISLGVLLIFIMITIYRGLRGDMSFEGISAAYTSDLKQSPFVSLTASERESIDAIEELMVSEQPFLDPDITLRSLSESLDLNERQLSRILNVGLEKSFFDFINSWRIQEVQRILIAEPKITILECMYRCGFNSKSSFNTAFKKHSGATPTAYRKKNIK